MRGTMLRAILGAGVAAGLVVTMSGVASAAPDTSRVSRTVVGIGSDTTYEVMNALDQVYNQSAGCAIIPTSGVTFTTYKQTCIAGGALSYDGALIETENEYHDRIVEAYPVGSGNGATALFQYVDGGSSVALPADFSRSSSKRTLTAESGMTQFESAYARDGISYWLGKTNTNVTQNTGGTLPTPNITSADLKAVFLGDGNPNTSNTGCAINYAKQANGTRSARSTRWATPPERRAAATSSFTQPRPGPVPARTSRTSCRLGRVRRTCRTASTQASPTAPASST